MPNSEAEPPLFWTAAVSASYRSRLRLWASWIGSGAAEKNVDSGSSKQPRLGPAPATLCESEKKRIRIFY